MKSARSKAKTVPAIDLTATDVSEVKLETTAPAPEQAALQEQSGSPDAPPEAPESREGATTPPQARSPTSPKLVPALIGLVAGAVGGFVAYQLSSAWQPKSGPASPPSVDSALVARLGALEQRIANTKPGDGVAAIPQALTDRLAKAESQLAEAVRREATAREERGKLATGLANETGERKKAIEALGARSAVGLAATPGPAAADLEGLKSRMGSIENTTKALPQSVTALGSKVDGLQPKLDSVTKDVQALSGRLAGLSTRDTFGAANAQLAAVALLDDAFARGAPLSDPLDLLKNLGADAGLLAALAPFAASGAPDAKKLLAELRSLKPAPAASIAEPEKSLFERVKRGAMSLVEIRRTGEVTGSDDTAHLTRVEQALGRGEISLGLELVSRLSPAAAPRYAGWRARVEAQLKAGEARSVLRSNAYAALAKTAASAK